MQEVRPELYGGNRITPLPPGAKDALRPGDSPYAFYRIPLDRGASHELDALASYTVLCKAESGATLALGDRAPPLADGDSAQVENRATTLTAHRGRATALVAGTEAAHVHGPSLTVTRAGRQYRVSKPWGHELWLTPEHPAYCLKELYIRAGNRTSLQYHARKEETILVFSGRMRLVFKADENVENDAVSQGDLGRTILSPLCAMHVPPGTLHRLEAMTDVVLYEASTPHLDDVIRVQDDTARPHGRVPSEHAGTERT